MVYFSIFPIHPNNPNAGDLNKLSSELKQFKVFLETKGAQLSKTPEFLCFYALPFINNIQVIIWTYNIAIGTPFFCKSFYD